MPEEEKPCVCALLLTPQKVAVDGKERLAIQQYAELADPAIAKRAVIVNLPVELDEEGKVTKGGQLIEWCGLRKALDALLAKPGITLIKEAELDGWLRANLPVSLRRHVTVGGFGYNLGPLTE